VRSTLNNRIARVIFAVHGNTMYLLHGFIQQPVGLKVNRRQNDLDGAYLPAFPRQGNNHWLEKRENLPSPRSFFASIL
jgi:hypothetical protein